VEAAIAEQLGVSRAPVREAILELAQQGLVKNIPRRGAYVIQWTQTDIEEVYTFRMALEGLAARLAASRITPEQCAELEAVIDTIRRRPDVPSSVQLDLHFHELICVASRHSRLQEAVAAMRTQTELFLRRTRPSQGILTDADDLADDHRAILEAVRSGDPALAEQRMRDHIESSGLRLIKGVTRWRGSSPATER